MHIFSRVLTTTFLASAKRETKVCGPTGIEPWTSGSGVRRTTDCAPRPSKFLRESLHKKKALSDIVHRKRSLNPTLSLSGIMSVCSFPESYLYLLRIHFLSLWSLERFFWNFGQMFALLKQWTEFLFQLYPTKVKVTLRGRSPEGNISCLPDISTSRPWGPESLTWVNRPNANIFGLVVLEKIF